MFRAYHYSQRMWSFQNENAMIAAFVPPIAKFSDASLNG